MAPTAQPEEHAVNSAAFRTGLRREKLAARMALDAATHAALSARIEARLLDLLGGLRCGVLAFCSPTRNEFDARPLIGRLIAAGWRASMPVAEQVAAPMRFRAWSPGAPMTQDRYGIEIPADAIDAGPPDAILLPVVAFDAAGYRLGYGGGYFDRTLAALVPRPLSIGVGFEVARVATIRAEAHDQPLDAVVTEDGVIRFSSGNRGVAYTAITDDHRV